MGGCHPAIPIAIWGLRFRVESQVWGPLQNLGSRLSLNSGLRISAQSMKYKGPQFAFSICFTQNSSIWPLVFYALSRLRRPCGQDLFSWQIANLCIQSCANYRHQLPFAPSNISYDGSADLKLFGLISKAEQHPSAEEPIAPVTRCIMSRTKGLDSSGLAQCSAECGWGTLVMYTCDDSSPSIQPLLCGALLYASSRV